MRCFTLRHCGWWLVAVWLSWCSQWAAPALALPRPSLPAVHWVKPNSPKAVVVGLTLAAVEALQERDPRWQQYVEFLEQRLQGDR